MTTYNVTGREYALHMRNLMPHVHEAAVKALRSTAKAGIAITVEEIDEVEAVDTGRLRQSVDSSSIKGGAVLTVDAPYAAAVNHGTRPHTPPLQPLIDWAKRKFSLDDEDAKRVAFAVQAKISKNGTEPTHFQEAAVERIVRDILPREMESALSKV